jgi:hypothetical protein
MGVAVEPAQCISKGRLLRTAMAPCAVEMLSGDVGEGRGQACSLGSPRGRKRAAHDERVAGGSFGCTSIKSKFGCTAVPYKKRKLKKSVKFSSSSLFRVVECVPGEWCEEAQGDACGSPHASADETGERGFEGSDSDAEAMPVLPTPTSPSHPCELEDSDTYSSPCRSPDVLREQKIVTKDGDGPSVVGLICNALVMGLVDRSISNTETALDAMRAQILQKSAQTPADPAWPSAWTSEGEQIVIENDVFEAVLERLQQLVEHLDRHDKVGLLPSTARLGKPFIPALKCLQGTLRLAAQEQHVNDAREDGEAVQDEGESIPTPRTPTPGQCEGNEGEPAAGVERAGEPSGEPSARGNSPSSYHL